MSRDTTIVVRAENLKKVYRLHEYQATTLKEMVVRNVFSRGRVRRHTALAGLSFELKAGSTLGVIGPNGSGKSTLLKLAAGIVAPTEGAIQTQGRVIAMLELGAGFHPEFTGMENIFLQSRILGLSRHEILKRLESIIEFSGLGDFIHTPTKRYSTGMVVRLGFSIAVHIEADLMLVDEVLAVGDPEFQRRCLDRIAERQREGCALLFVSHDLSQIERVADQVLWLDHGQARMLGNCQEVLQQYEKEAQGIELAQGPRKEADTMSMALMDRTRMGTGEALIRSVDIVRIDGSPARQFRQGEPLQVVFDLEVVNPLPAIELLLALGNSQARGVAITRSALSIDPARTPFLLRGLPKGRHRVVCELDPPNLTPGQYLLSCSLSPAGDALRFLDIHLRLYRFSVVAEDPGDIPATTPQPLRTPTPLYLPPATWEE